MTKKEQFELEYVLKTSPKVLDKLLSTPDGLSEWFADDVTERFRQFLRVIFGDDHYDENLAFIEQALDRDLPQG